MKIAVVNTVSPFVYGGAEFVISDMIQNLKQIKDVEVFQFEIPFPSEFHNDLIKFTNACRSLNLDDYDMLLSYKYPAYCIPHRNKVVWLFHQFRQVYELWDTEFGFKSTDKNIALKNFVESTDRIAFQDSKKVFSLSKEVGERLKNNTGISSEILYAPLKDSEKYFHSSFGDYIFYPSRVSAMKRQHLAIEAMVHTKTDVKLVVAGKCVEPSYQTKIDKIISTHNLDKKVILLGEISQEDKFELFAKCLGSAFLPFKEDYGLVTLEAGLSGKPTISTHDSGGVVELITHNQNGIVVSPTPLELAKAFDNLYLDKSSAKNLGRNAYEFVKYLDLRWNKIIDRILS